MAQFLRIIETANKKTREKIRHKILGIGENCDTVTRD